MLSGTWYIYKQVSYLCNRSSTSTESVIKILHTNQFNLFKTKFVNIFEIRQILHGMRINEKQNLWSKYDVASMDVKQCTLEIRLDVRFICILQYWMWKKHDN